MKNIAIFASGTGSNAQKIIDHFRSIPHGGDREPGVAKKIQVALIVTNKPEAGVVQIGRKENIPLLFLEKEKFFRGNAYVDELKGYNIDLIVLAGFLWKIPLKLIDAYRNRIINIHPALLPKYGGKGLYGNFVHQSVIQAGEKESGVTIHYVDEHYDHGDIIFQAKCPINNDETAESLAQKIHQLEYANYPRVIEELLTPCPPEGQCH